MPEFISEQLLPHQGTFDTRRMGRGEPGLPGGFDWRDDSFAIVQELDSWKHSSREGSHAQGDLYLRRHYFRLRMSDDTIWVVYFERQPPRSGNAKARWFLYTREPAADADAAP